MLWGGTWEGGSCLGMHVRIKDFKIKKKKKSNGIFSARVLDLLGTHDRFLPFNLSLLEWECLTHFSHHYIFEADNLLSSFTGLQEKRYFDPG